MNKTNSLVAGIDIGAATAKAVILRNSDILASVVIPTGAIVAIAGDTVMKQALEKAGVGISDLKYIVSTGYGRRAVPFANKALTEILCHGVGVSWLMPAARTIIDIGGQDSKVIGLDERGTVVNFVMNDKCAAGTGRFLEVMATVLGIRINDMGPVSLQGKEPCQISSTCTVFAESEMVSLRAEGKTPENIIAGIHKALAHRVSNLGARVGFKKELVFTGGVAKNVGIKKALEDEIGLQILIPQDPQSVGALGAALMAQAELTKIQQAD